MSVDFVAITALVVGLGIVLLSLVSAGIQAASESIDDSMRGMRIQTTFGPTPGAGASGGTPTVDDEFGLTDPGQVTSSAGSGGGTILGGNPGNDKNVGDAGENPNGGDGWGSGSGGQSF